MLIGAVIGLSITSWAQTFEVATVKKVETTPSFAGIGCRGVDIGPSGVPQGRCRFPSSTLTSLIMAAYGVSPYELDGTTGWMDSDRWAIEGVAPDTATVKRSELLAMLKAKLEEGFKLRFHSETRTVEGYVLSVTDEKKLALMTENDDPKVFRTRISNNVALSGLPVINRVTLFAGPLSGLPRFLSNYFGAPVKDATAVTGNYKVNLDWGRDISDATEGQSALLALLSENGLRFKTEKVTVEVMVIDSAQKPE
jgi:uncharacterized protein (TIGR03435 family)